MKTTSSAGAPLKSASEQALPLGSGSRKSGAWVPSGNIVELTATMQRTCYARPGCRMEKGGQVLE